MKGIIIVLGSPNNYKGDLSRLGIGRASKGIELLRKNKDYKILPTGGFGWNFNRTKEPHHKHLERYLMRNGVDKNAVLHGVESRNTVDDFVLAKKVVDEKHVSKIMIVSSDFHVPRVKLIATAVFQGDYDLKFVKVRSPLATRILNFPHEIIRRLQIRIFGLLANSTNQAAK